MISQAIRCKLSILKPNNKVIPKVYQKASIQELRDRAAQLLKSVNLKDKISPPQLPSQPATGIQPQASLPPLIPQGPQWSGIGGLGDTISVWFFSLLMSHNDVDWP